MNEYILLKNLNKREPWKTDWRRNLNAQSVFCLTDWKHRNTNKNEKTIINSLTCLYSDHVSKSLRYASKTGKLIFEATKCCIPNEITPRNVVNHVSMWEAWVSCHYPSSRTLVASWTRRPRVCSMNPSSVFWTSCSGSVEKKGNCSS